MIGIINKILLIFILFFIGCSPSIIKINSDSNVNSYSMFGRIPERSFFIDEELSDSLNLKWEAEINGSFSNSSVTIYGNYVFVNDLSGRVYCFNSLTGKEVGKIKLDGSVFTAPVIDNGIIIFINTPGDENRSELYYYNFFNGDFTDEIEIKGKVTGNIIKTNDGILFAAENGIIYRYNFSGGEIWQTETNSITHSSPVLINNTVILGNDKGEIIGVNYKDGKILYREKIGKSFFGKPIVKNNIAFIGDDNGFLYAVDIKKGEVKWKYNSGARITAAPALSKSNIFFGNLSGYFFSLDINSGELIWKTYLDGVLNITPLAANNLLVVPNLSMKFDFVDSETGNITKTIPLEGRGKLSPVYFNNLLYIGYDKGILRAYEIIK